MNINWYPGHMKKTKETIKNSLPLVDIVYEVLDARMPMSSKNPDIDDIIGNKPRLIILNKADLSNEEYNKKWEEFFYSKKIPTIFVNSLNGTGLNQIIKKSNILIKDKMDRLQKKGVKNRPIRAMILGIPNVGKSTLINSLSGKKGAKTGNKPGVTKGNQWIKIKGNLELLDTPGILWPKLEDKDSALNLAFTGAIKDELLDIENLAFQLLDRLIKLYPGLVKTRYNIDLENYSTYEVMDQIAKSRGCILKGGEIDFTRASNTIVDDFRKGKIGKITLELP